MPEIDFYNRTLETAGRAHLEAVQDEKLRRLGQVLNANLFYGEKLCPRGGDGGDLARNGLADLAKVPFTTKAELVEDQRTFAPFGRLPSFPLSRYPYFHQTSGTSGNPLLWLDTASDWETWIRCWGYVYRAAGVNESDVAFFAFSFGPYISHWAALDGARRLGVCCIPGGGMNSLQRLQAIQNYGATVVLCTPTYALRLAEVAEENGMNLATGSVRITIHAGEPGASVPHVRTCIEKAWGAVCFDHAGATEVGAWGFECEAHTGAMHLNEAEFIFEVIDPETEASVSEELTGELVVTALGRTGMPVVRYRTGDVVVPTREPCPCGRTWTRIRGGVLGRTDDMMIVRGVNVYPSAIDDIVRSRAGVIEYEVEVKRHGPLSELLVKVEASGAEVPATIERAFRERLNLGVSVQQVPLGSLPRYESKARRYKTLE
jgi:phenylacetate-CoA ligase